ncbi:MAG: TPM domain-containing protein [Bacteroidetes bacterium]|nr:TPM domain-containing protein [Bacteroidota bacterium]
MFFKKRLLSAADDARLIKAIQFAEAKTSGEIRVHIEKTCKGDALEECKKTFCKAKYATNKRPQWYFVFSSH